MRLTLICENNNSEFFSCSFFLISNYDVMPLFSEVTAYVIFASAILVLYHPWPRPSRSAFQTHKEDNSELFNRSFFYK